MSKAEQKEVPAAPWPGKRIDMADFARDVARRRAAYEAENGPLLIPRNSGTRRTESKKALLKAIEDIGGKW